MDRLSTEVAMARAAGMSYGTWKALHPVSEYIEEKPVEPENLRMCKRCGKPILRKVGEKAYTYKKRMYCSDICRKGYFYESKTKQQIKEKQAKINRKPGKCQWCNKQIPAVDEKGRKVRYDRKYCSNTCRQTYLYYQKGR